MAEVMYMIELSDYRMLKPQLNEYENELLDAYAKRGKAKVFERLSERRRMLEDLRGQIRCVAVGSCLVTDETVDAMRIALGRVKLQDSGAWTLLRAISQAISAGPDELGLFLARFANWRTAEVTPIIEAYERAVNETLAVVVLPQE